MEKPHKQLDVWRIAMGLIGNVYSPTQTFPADERFGLVSQMRRAAVSVASNIAEGAARKGRNELRHFATIAQASLSELDTQMDIALMLGFITPDSRSQMDEVMVRVDRMLYRLIQSC